MGRAARRARLPDALSDLASTDAAFSPGGKTYAACYSNDFRISIYNKKMFDKAGITDVPATLDRARPGRRQAQGRRASSTRSRSRWRATEGGVTPWYLLTLANGGQLFDNNFKPDVPEARARPATRRCSGRRCAVKKGWVSPGAVSLDDAVAFDKFTAGETAIVLATGPGQPRDGERQEPVEHRRRTPRSALVPGVDGPGASFGLPEGLSIPVTAKHKAAAAAFIEWWERARERDRDLQQAGQPALRRLGRSSSSPTAASSQGGDVLERRS